MKNGVSKCIYVVFIWSQFKKNYEFILKMCLTVILIILTKWVLFSQISSNKNNSKTTITKLQSIVIMLIITRITIEALDIIKKSKFCLSGCIHDNLKNYLTKENCVHLLWRLVILVFNGFVPYLRLFGISCEYIKIWGKSLKSLRQWYIVRKAFALPQSVLLF